MIYYIFNIVFTLVVFHIVYESIIAPSYRMSLRNELFALRDKLRAHQVAKGSKLDKAAFSIVADGVDNFLNRLSSVSWAVERRISKMLEEDEALRNRMKSRDEILERCEDQELLGFVEEASIIIGKAFVANHGAWSALLVPLLLLMMFFGSLYNFCARLFMLPKNEVTSVLPNHRPA